MLLNTYTHTSLWKGKLRICLKVSAALSRVSSGNVLLTLIFPDALPWYVGFLTSSMAGKGEQGDESLTYSDGIHDATIPANT